MSHGQVSCRTLRLLALVVEQHAGALPVAFTDDLPSDWRTEADRMVPRSVADAAWSTAISACPGVSLGLEMAAVASIASFGLLGYVAAQGPTLTDAYAQVVRFTGLLQKGTSTWSVAPRDGGLAYTYTLRPPLVSAWPHIVDYALASFVLVGALLHGGPLDTTVELGHGPLTDANRYRALLGPRVRFDAPRHAVWVPDWQGRRPLPNADPELGRLLRDVAAQRAPKEQPTTAQMVQSILLETIPTGSGTMPAVAERMAVSERTLRRQLSDEGTSFRALLDEARFALARRFLDNPRLSSQDIALLLGFTDVSAFYRAFPRWSGQSLSAFRRAYNK